MTYATLQYVNGQNAVLSSNINANKSSINKEDVEVLKYNNEVIWEKNKNPEVWTLLQTLSDIPDISFKAESVLFTSINCENNILKYADIVAYNNDWSTTDYKTLKFDFAPLGAIRTWLTQIGAVKS